MSSLMLSQQAAWQPRGLLRGDAHGAHKLRVVTTIPDFTLRPRP
jgi:hypothetical protein